MRFLSLHLTSPLFLTARRAAKNTPRSNPPWTTRHSGASIFTASTPASKKILKSARSRAPKTRRKTSLNKCTHCHFISSSGTALSSQASETTQSAAPRPCGRTVTELTTAIAAALCSPASAGPRSIVCRACEIRSQRRRRVSWSGTPRAGPQKRLQHPHLCRKTLQERNATVQGTSAGLAICYPKPSK